MKLFMAFLKCHACVQACGGQIATFYGKLINSPFRNDKDGKTTFIAQIIVSIWLFVQGFSMPL